MTWENFWGPGAKPPKKISTFYVLKIHFGAFFDINQCILKYEKYGLYHVLKIKTASGHKTYKVARAMAAYEDVNCKHEGLITESVLDEISSGLLVEVTIPGGSYEGEHAELVRKSFEALASPKCRVSFLRATETRIDDEAVRILAEALKVNTSIKDIR